ncbi:MAG: F0F1 ATP synthase subunit epsilon [Chlorobi bacterium]|nr:F0F1 ATP synthase subunit epsilon [Chlorobiota bacterium]
MKVEIVSPQQKLLDTEADMVAVPGINGEFAMLDNHAPIIALLEKGTVRVQGKNLHVDEDNESFFQHEKTKDKEQLKLPIKSGTVEMNNNRVIILVEL